MSLPDHGEHHAHAPARRSRVAGAAAGIILGLLALAMTFCGSCQNVPNEALKSSGDSGGNGGESYDQWVSEARGLYAEQPHSEQRLRKAAEKFSKAAGAKADDYAMLCDAARVYSWLAKYVADNDERTQFSKEGLKFVSTAMVQKPDEPEALYLHAVLAGRLASADKSYGLDSLGQIEKDCKRLIELGADIEHAGAHRLYGAMLLRAPGPPISIGSLRNARKQFELMLEKAPDWPENHVYMAELEFKWAKEKNLPEEAQKARDRLQKYLLGAGVLPPPEAQFEFTQWQAQARKLIDESK